MAHEGLPLYRLATLLARQISSPIATRIKVHAKEHPLLGRSVCMRIARLYRTAELRCKLWTLHLPQPKTVPAISDEVALEVGADMLGELIVFTLGSMIIIFEVNRQAANKEVKELAKTSQWMAVKLQLEEIGKELQMQDADILRLQTKLTELARIREEGKHPTNQPLPSKFSPTLPPTISQSDLERL